MYFILIFVVVFYIEDIGIVIVCYVVFFFYFCGYRIVCNVGFIFFIFNVCYVFIDLIDC